MGTPPHENRCRRTCCPGRPVARRTAEGPVIIAERAAAHHAGNISITDFFKFFFGVERILFVLTARPFPHVTA
ncbi:MAG TPA: hypothetical protein VI753_07355, partial [Anaerolineales bacterium]|nr:hypothetical protein [Anaerolineales bacterium]